jgi:hypothetical protein
MAICTLKIEDVDIDTGEVSITVEVEGSKVDDGHMTAAEVMIRVLNNDVHSPAFREKLWAEIAKMTSGTNARIANDDQAPKKKCG